MVYLLKKSIYRLKQCKWFDDYIIKDGFLKSEYDHFVYINGVNSTNVVYFLLYMDVMLVSSKSKVEITRIKVQLSREFEMKELGKAKRILGMEINRERKSKKISLSQSLYVDKLVERLGISFAKPIIAPLAQQFKLSSSCVPEIEEHMEYMSKVLYENTVGCLMYLMVCTRLDLAYIVSLIIRFMSKSRRTHWEAVKWVFR